MIIALLLPLYLLGAVAFPAYGHPLDWLPRASDSTDRAWSLWGLFWMPDATVTVVRNEPVTFLSRPAGFGGALAHSRLGYVIPLSSFTAPCANGTAATFPIDSLEDVQNLGCPRLCITGPHVPDPTEPWIALVQRGECQFVEKAREAQRLGAKAVVVGGDKPEWHGNADTLVNMWDPGNSDDVTIEATFVRYSDYNTLFSMIETSETVHSGLRTVSLLISSETSPGGWLSPALTFISILLLPSILTFVTLLVHRFRTVRAAQRERAPEDIVRSLPWRVWTGNGWEKHEGMVPGHEHPCTSPPALHADAPIDLERGMLVRAAPAPAETRPSTSDAEQDDAAEPPWANTQTECAICLSEFAVGDRVRVLPCNHIFHLDEVDAWLINSRKLCPVCKADVTQPAATYHGLPPDVGSAGTDDRANSGAEGERDGSSPTETTPLLSGVAAPPPASRP